MGTCSPSVWYSSRHTWHSVAILFLNEQIRDELTKQLRNWWNHWDFDPDGQIVLNMNVLFFDAKQKAVAHSWFPFWQGICCQECLWLCSRKFMGWGEGTCAAYLPKWRFYALVSTCQVKLDEKRWKFTSNCEWTDSTRTERVETTAHVIW